MGQTDQLRQALDLTNQMLVAIEQVELDAITELDHQRQNLIKQYYQDERAIDVELTRQLKQHTRERQLHLRQSSQASRAYRSNLP